MSATSSELTVRPEYPVDASHVEVLCRISSAAHSLGIQYCICGAFARDLMLQHVHGQSIGRRTLDIDLGIYVDRWDTFETLKTLLVERKGFEASTVAAHRLTYRAFGRTHAIPVDLIPFGGITRPDRTIAWPPDMQIIMNIDGFAEAIASAQRMKISNDLVVPVVSLPALAILKLIAWRDRHQASSKDATDLLLIVRRYSDAGNQDRLYDTEQDCLAAYDYDPDLAAAMLLGKDATKLCEDTTQSRVAQILTEEASLRALIDQMLEAPPSAGDDQHHRRIEQLMQAFCAGFLT